MKYLNYFFILFLIIFLSSCSFKPIKPSMEQESISPSCGGLISIVKKNWKQHKKLKYYKCSEDFLTKFQRDYMDCLMTFKKSEVINLLGSPTEDLGEGIYYSLDESCMGELPEDCRILFFQFRNGNGNLAVVQVQDYMIHIHNK